MDLSIIIPVYNTEKEALCRCFDSIKISENISFEVVIIDDGSGDETAQLCRDYTQTHSGFYYFRQENQGVSVARNTGISRANGRYVMFLDSDDELLCDAIEKDVLESSYDLVFFDIELHEANRIKHMHTFDNTLAGTLDKKVCLAAACQDKLNSSYARLYRRIMLLDNTVFFDVDMKVAEDAAFVLKAVVAAEKIGYVPVPAYRYFHSFANGNERLMRFPEYIIQNAIQLQCARDNVLTQCGAQLFTDAELRHQRMNVADRLIRALFEARGSLLVLRSSFNKLDDLVISRAEEMYRIYAKEFPSITRIKCFLLKKNLKEAITAYACLREVYIRVRR